jgi:hypothetical protein
MIANCRRFYLVKIYTRFSGKQPRETVYRALVAFGHLRYRMGLSFEFLEVLALTSEFDLIN